MPATLLDHVAPAMQIYRDESFGPVKPIVRVDGVDAAIACANDNEYGLISSMAPFSKPCLQVHAPRHPRGGERRDDRVLLAGHRRGNERPSAGRGV